MTELETLIDQQAREMRYPWRTFHWSRRSVAAAISLDIAVGEIGDGSLRLVDVLVDGVNAWLPWRFAPTPIEVDPDVRALGITDALSSEERDAYYADWVQA